MLTLDTFQFEERLPELQERFRQEISASDGKPILLSHEGFQRVTRFGGHDWSLTSKRMHRVFVECLDLELDAHIIIVLRNQAELLLSHFVHFVKGRQRDFDTEIETLLRDPTKGFGSSLFYADTLDHYSALFGADRVHVLLFEQFQRDTLGFTSELSRILGIDARISSSLLQGGHEKRKVKHTGSYLVADRKSPYFVLAKLLRRFRLDSWAGRVTERSRHPVGLSAEQIDRLAELYRASNAATEARYGIKLAAHGYPTLATADIGTQ